MQLVRHFNYDPVSISISSNCTRRKGLDDAAKEALTKQKQN